MHGDVAVAGSGHFDNGGRVERPCCAQRGQQVGGVGDAGVGHVVGAAEAAEVYVGGRGPHLRELVCTACAQEFTIFEIGKLEIEL